MNVTISKIEENKLYNELTSGIGTLVLTRLNEIDSSTSTTPVILEILKQAYQNEKNPVLQFQLKKSLRYAVSKIKKITLNVAPNVFENLIRDQNRIDDLALAVISLDTVSGFLVADQLRAADWQYFAPEILPIMCCFFKQFGGFEDIPTLLELTRHSNPIVVIAAINALETIDPTNLQGIVEPLLDSPSNDIKVQAIQVYYKWNRKDAIDKFVNMLFSENAKDKSLAIFHSEFFQFSDIESFLMKLLPHISNKFDLMNLMRVFVKNANLDLPLKIYLINNHLEGEQHALIKGLLLNVIRELSKIGIIQSSIQDYLAELKEKANLITDEEAFILNTSSNEVPQKSINTNNLPEDFTSIQEKQNPNSSDQSEDNNQITSDQQEKIKLNDQDTKEANESETIDTSEEEATKTQEET